MSCLVDRLVFGEMQGGHYFVTKFVLISALKNYIVIVTKQNKTLQEVTTMKRVVNLPTIRIEAFTSIVLEGEDIVMYHLYINNAFIRATSSKQEILDLINARIGLEVGVI